MEHFLKDVRLGIRVLRKSPGFTLVAVIALALGIGANTTIFSAINALLLHPFSFRDIGQLVMIWETRPKVEVERNVASFANYLDVKNQTTPFTSVAASTNWWATSTKESSRNALRV